MNLRLAFGALALGVGLSAAGLASAGGVHHEVDGAHAWAIFKTSHMGISNLYGRFNSISGTVDIDDAAPEKSTVEISLKTDSIDTQIEARDKHLKGPDFFDAKQYPTITFKSTKVAKDGVKGDGWEVTGDLTLHGVTKPITVHVEKTGEGDIPTPNGKVHHVGFETTFSVKRSDFGVKYGVMPDGKGDEVTFTLSLEAAKK
jgi:polyisoprenoid-binding protein YceI